MLSLHDFAAAAGETFSLDLGTSAMTLTLVEVKPLTPYPGAMRKPFSLVFRATSPVVLPQKVYSLSAVTLGRHGIFLVPIGRDAAGVLYQAVFN